jgi:hypothetical protein
MAAQYLDHPPTTLLSSPHFGPAAGSGAPRIPLPADPSPEALF